MKHIVCYSGGHSSALVAVEVARRFGAENTVLLNHDIHASVEDSDIKRFKREVAAYLGIPVTQANMPGWDTMDQFDVVMAAKAFKVGHNQQALCTNRLKTQPFHDYLAANFPGGEGCTVYYGFDRGEVARIQRRSSALAAMGYRSDYPLALWHERTIASTKEIGIEPPLTYGTFKHANCVGCLKAKKQHWYVVYCLRPDVWAKAKLAEDAIGHSIQPDAYLDEIEPEFALMKAHGVTASEHIEPNLFWAKVRKTMKGAKAGQVTFLQAEQDMRPCECVF